MIPYLRIRSSTPGSYPAILAGCTCDPKRNRWGVASETDHWTTSDDCELHGTPERFEALPHRITRAREWG